MMAIMRFLFCLLLFAFNMQTITWIPEDNSEDSTPLTEEQKKAAMVRWEEWQAQDTEYRKKLFERYHQALLKKDENTFFALMPSAILGIVLEYQFPIKPKIPTIINKTDSDHISYGVPGVCCCERCP